MITLISCARRVPSISHAHFERYWRDRHGPLVCSVPDFVRHVLTYSQFHLTDLLPLDTAAVLVECDGVGILRFGSQEALDQAFVETQYLNTIRPDTRKFLDYEASTPFFTRETALIEAPVPVGAVTLFEFSGTTSERRLLSWVESARFDDWQAGNAEREVLALAHYEVVGGPGRHSVSDVATCTFKSLTATRAALAELAPPPPLPTADPHRGYVAATEYRLKG